MYDIIILNNPTKIYIIFEYIEYDLRKFIKNVKLNYNQKKVFLNILIILSCYFNNC